MKQIETRTRPRIPAVHCGSNVASARLDRHLAVLGGPPRPVRETEEAAGLMLDLASQGRNRAAPRRTASVFLLAPLRRLHRTLFGGHR